MFHHKFSEIAEKYADMPAVMWRGSPVSYRELNKKSDEIAAGFLAGGVGPGDILPIQMERGAEWIAYCLGILKAGAAFAPISPSTPPERLTFILSDIEKGTGDPDAFAVYYTSGSTGTPKGVILSHSGILAFCEAHLELFGASKGIKSGVQADVGFDSFLMVTLPILYSGGTIYLMDDAERMSLIGLHRFLIKNRIETIFLTTQLAVEYMRSFDNKHLKTLLTGGEALRTHTPRSYAVYNLYGPTECTVYVTAYQLKAGDSGDIPIGVPTGQNRVYILDGELCVSGPGLAIGYLGRPEETARKFVPNPHYDPNTDDPCYSRMYHTGDMAEWGKAGEILYRGRIDNMVKISGYRIEPGEIEITLSKHPELAAACVTARYTSSGEIFLAAYCVAREIDVSPDDLKAFLARSLPVYMIPRKFIMLKKLPFDERTGKVDVSVLPVPE